MFFCFFGVPTIRIWNRWELSLVFTSALIRVTEEDAPTRKSPRMAIFQGLLSLW